MKSKVIDIKSEKLELIQWLAGISDAAIIKNFLALKKEIEVDWWDEISGEERLAIDEGLAQIDNGEIILHQDVMDKVQKKFNL